MKTIVCEMCGNNNLVKQDGVFVCQYCGTQYSVEEAKKMMVEIEGNVDVTGSTIKVDNSAFVEKYLANARRAYEKEDWEEVEKYYNLVEQNAPNNMEAVFFSAFGKTMLAMTDEDYYKKQQKFNVLIKSISVINDYYELTNEDKKAVLVKISEAINKMYDVTYVYKIGAIGEMVGSDYWHKKLINQVKDAFVIELNQINEIHDEEYIKEMINKTNQLNTVETNEGCYVATCVYGSYNCPQVWTLRRYRDNTLSATWYGRAFVKLYYAVSPTLVKWFGHTNWFKKMWKSKLDKMVKKLNDQGVENTPYYEN